MHSLLLKGQHPYMVQGNAFTTTQRSAPLYGPGECIHYHSKVSTPIWSMGMHSQPLKGQHPYMVHGNAFTTTQRSAPLYGPWECIHNQPKVSTPIWSRGCFHYHSKVSTPMEAQGAALVVKGHHQCGSGGKSAKKIQFQNFCDSNKPILWHRAKRSNKAMTLLQKLDSWCFEPSQPQRIISGLKTNFNLSPSYSAQKSSNHKFFKIYKISPDTNVYQNKTYTHKH